MGTVDVDTDQAAVRQLLHEQHRDLAELPLRLVPGGWDNRLWRLGDELAVRLPRRPSAVSLLRNEQRWLPTIASRLSLPVPTPVRLGDPSQLFPRPWSIARWVNGEPADRAPIHHGDESADRLARFLRALHVPAPAQAPRNPLRGVPLAARDRDFHESLAAAASHADTTGVQEVWEQALSTPEGADAPMWLHGDMHPANVVTTEGTLAGIIDFGDICAGDPATDVAAAWTLLPDQAIRHFLAAYGADPALIQRARGWAVLTCLSLLNIGEAGLHGRPGGKPTWKPAGRRSLDRILNDTDHA